MTQVVIQLMVFVAYSSCQLVTMTLEGEVERNLEKVLADHKAAWTKMEDDVMTIGAREERSGFPTIKRKRKKIRACQNMAG